MTLNAALWVDRNLNEVWDRLVRVVPKELLPVGESDLSRWRPGDRRPRIVFEELGCGHYGCVMPTGEPGLVFKITSDISEAAFVARALTLEPTAGIVEYKKIFGIPQQTHKGRPLFILWRSEVSDVGKWAYYMTHQNDPNPEYVQRITLEARNLLTHFLDWAGQARKYMYSHLRDIQKMYVGDDLTEVRRKLLTAAWAAYERMDPAQEMRSDRVSYIKGLNRVGMALRTCLYISQEMSGNASLYHVGEALGHYLEEGILLADVHFNNIGLDENNEPIISDPGHAVEFHPRWAKQPVVENL